MVLARANAAALAAVLVAVHTAAAAAGWGLNTTGENERLLKELMSTRQSSVKQRCIDRFHRATNEKKPLYPLNYRIRPAQGVGPAYGADQWCDCVQQEIFSATSEADQVRAAYRCKEKVIDRLPINGVYFCMRTQEKLTFGGYKYPWCKSDSCAFSRPYYCPDCLPETGPVPCTDQNCFTHYDGCEKSCVRGFLAPGYCQQSVTYAPWRVLSEVSSIYGRKVVVDGMEMANLQTTDETPEFPSIYNTQPCAKLSPSNDDECCSAKRTAIFGSCCSKSTFTCSTASAALFNLCVSAAVTLQKTGVNEACITLAEKLDTDGVTHSDGKIELTDDIGRSVCSSFARRSSSVSIATSGRCADVSDASSIADEQCCCMVKTMFGDIITSEPSFCWDDGGNDGGDNDDDGDDGDDGGDSDDGNDTTGCGDDPCKGTCLKGFDCVTKGEKTFCVDCGHLFVQNDSKIETCCKFTLPTKGCRLRTSSSDERFRCKREDGNIFFTRNGEKILASFERNSGIPCPHISDFVRNGGACRVRQENSGSYSCKLREV